ncbi:MAG: urease accessory protein UreF [Beijerinckiaceae bacterium]
MTLNRALVWFSPAFPIGAFSFSHGLEWAVESGDIADRQSLEDWIRLLLVSGSGWSDVVLFALAHKATAARNMRKLHEVAELAVALQPSKERRLEATMQGDAFVKAVETGWPNAGLAFLREAIEPPHALCVAGGAATAGVGLTVEAATGAYLTGFCQNLISAAIRLAPIGQSDGLRVMAALEDAIADTARRACRATLKDVGGMALRSDIASMRHETQMTRLFRS